MAERFVVASRSLWSMRAELASAIGGEVVRLRPGSGAACLVGWADRRGAVSRVLARALGLAFRPVLEGAAPSSFVVGEPGGRLRADGTLAGRTVHLDLYSRRPIDAGEAARQAAFLRDAAAENARPSVCVGVSRWKRRRIARFLEGDGGPPVFVGSPGRAVARAKACGGRVVAWETRMPRRLDEICAAAGVPLLRMEDGFLRSVGLGAAFLPGASCVLDGRGIYYDPRRESDLEHILATATFDKALVARAAALREEVVALRLSKYNVGRPAALDGVPTDRPVVLVPGQVEDDASVLLGSPGCRGNRALLEAARRRNPDAYLIFKPHPDVEAGLRRGRIPEDEVRRLADRVVADAPIVDLLERVDAVETMTSLAGFEALMRGVPTIVHGRPFYAGWGLTQDRDPPERRSRRLALDELVAGALILYPRYLDPLSGLRCPPEVLVRHLAAARDAAVSTPSGHADLRAAYVRVRHQLLTPIGALIRRARGGVRDAGDGA